MPSPMACVEFTPKVGSSVQVGTGKLTLPARYAPRVQIMVTHDLRTLERTLRPSASFDAPQGWAPLNPNQRSGSTNTLFAPVVCCSSSSIHSLLLITVYFRTLYFRTLYRSLLCRRSRCALPSNVSRVLASPHYLRVFAPVRVAKDMYLNIPHRQTASLVFDISDKAGKLTLPAQCN